MLKYFRKQKNGRLDFVVNEDEDVDNDVGEDEVICHQNTKSFPPKDGYLRTTSSFCDEIFLDELLKGTELSNVTVSEDEDAISCGALSLDALSSVGVNSIPSNVTIVGTDKGLFKYHTRLSMSISSIVNEPNCLSYFVQYLEKKKTALPLIKFYLDTENFKNAALAEIRKAHRTCDSIQNNKSDQSESEECYSDVPELKTLCDLSMRKPITDDEKTQIYEETNKKLCLKKKEECAASVLSLSSNLSSNKLSQEFIYDAEQICERSIQDALTIYQRYLIHNAPYYIKIPVDILSKISLILCKKSLNAEDQVVNNHCTRTITANCFIEAQHFTLEQLERDYLMEFLQSTYYSKYCLELVESGAITIYDILYSEMTLFYFMEYLEQQNERHCLDFWSAAVNYRKSHVSKINDVIDMKQICEARSDAMIIYEKFFSLQLNNTLWASSKLRAYVESTICSDEWVIYCFDLPLKVAATYMERKFLHNFLKAPIFGNYLNELKMRIDREDEGNCAGDGDGDGECDGDNARISSLTSNIQKITLRRCSSDKANRTHRKTLSDCTYDKKFSFISQQNTLLASMDSPSMGRLKQFKLDIDANQLNDPQLLWHRSSTINSANNSTSNGGSCAGKSLRFGRVNPFGRYERDFISPADAAHQSSLKGYHHHWSIPLNGDKFKKVMRKLVHLPEDNVQEEIAWQVAEMIVKDITKVTMDGKSTTTTITAAAAAATTTTASANNMNKIT